MRPLGDDQDTEYQRGEQYEHHAPLEICLQTEMVQALTECFHGREFLSER